MITKRPSTNTGTLVLFIAAVLVILTVAIVFSLNPAIFRGSTSVQKRVQEAGSSKLIPVTGNFDAEDYYMTHPKALALVNFDAYDYYMTHPRTQATANFDANDYYVSHPKAQALVNFDAYDYYMTHPKGFDAYDNYTILPREFDH
jgi:hypothetical protein